MGFFDSVRFIVTHPLGRRAPLLALRRFASWQVASRLSPGAIAVPFIGDARLLVKRGMTGATGNVYVGLHEFEEMAFVLHALRRDDLFLDAGANVGSYTILAAKVVGCRCVSIEPIEATVASLLDNLALNRILDRVDVQRCAVGESEGVVRMTTQGDTVNRVVTADVADTGEAGQTTQVPQHTLDAILGDDTPAVFKMDVEGQELQALRGAERVLARPALQACILETLGANDGIPGEPWPAAAILEKHGFSPASYDPWQRRLSPISALNTAGNTIFVRDFHAVAERVRSAPAFEALGQRC